MSAADVKPLLPAVDAAGLLRETAFALLVRDRRPIDVADLAGEVGLQTEVAAASVAALADSGWLDLDASGRVVGAAGLSLSTGAHLLSLGTFEFRTWCAYDLLGIAAALGTEANVETACGQCQAPIHLAFRGGVPERLGPEQLWLAEGGTDLRGSVCTPTVLLCGDEHGAAWGLAQDGHGQLLDLAEGARLGGLDWAGCAAAARRLT